MPVVDTLVTRYVADTKGYEAGAARVAAGSRRVSAALSAAGGAARAGGLLLAAAGAGAAALGVKSMMAAASFDTMTRKFAGAFGSFEAARAMMADLELAATKSAFSLEALAQAASMLAVSGMDVKRFLPLVERFALVVSGVDPEGLTRVAAALMRAKGGSFGEAMEVSRRAGIGAPELRAQGLTVTKGGEIKGTSEEFLSALERASEPLRRIAEAVTGGAENTISNAGAALGRAFRVLGAELNERLLPKLAEFTEAVSGFVDSGGAAVLADAFAGLADALTGGGGMVAAVDTAAAGMYAAARFAKDFVEFWSAALRSFADWIKRPARSLPELGIKAGLLIPGMAADAAAQYLGALRGEFEAGKASRRSRPGTGDAAAAATAASPGPVPSRAEAHLQAIEENTRRLVEMQRIVLGGGALGAAGVSPVRINQRPADGSPRLARAIGIVIEELAAAGRPPGMARR